MRIFGALTMVVLFVANSIYLGIGLHRLIIGGK